MSAGPLSWVAEYSGLVLAVTGASLTLAAAAGLQLLRQRRSSADVAVSLERARTQIDTQMQRDSLTGLLSRSEFELALDDAVLRSDRGAGRLCVMYVDIDNLGSVNEALGHAAGDAVLRESAARLVAGLGGALLAASRIAADEFVLILQGDSAAGRQGAAALAAAIALPFTIGAREVRLTCSVGFAAYPQHGSRPRLMAHAALAMRSVKLLGGNGHAEYDAQMSVAQREQAELLQDLRAALERRQFELVYQPKVDARSLQITAAEALLRWRHPQRGMVSPVLFIPLAERFGLIDAIGDWVLQEACRQSAEWRQRGLRMRVAINLSGYQLRQDDLVKRLEAALKKHKIPASRFTCEITESVAMEDTRVTREAFEQLRRAGVHVSIDDFGTGHSSLASLRRLPAAELKIDRAFVCDLESSQEARTIAGAIVQMAHTLGLRVVAEGVESQVQRDLLIEMGCDELQGYLFARPMSATALGLWATDDRPASAAEAVFRPSLFEATRPAELRD
jgi:diguanylate cyclase (GGDEF)-like protein